MLEIKNVLWETSNVIISLESVFLLTTEVAGAWGILCDPGGNIIVHYSWGLGNTSNNVAETYASWQRVRIAKIRGLRKLIILGDSMIMIRALINHKDIGNKAISGTISQVLSLIKEFDEYKFFHIKHHLNSQVDRWAKQGSMLGESVFVVNGEQE
jgi:ribonuclease HI